MNSWICLRNWHCLMPFTSLSLSLSCPILHPSSDLASRVLAGKDHLGGRADLGWAGIRPTSAKKRRSGKSLPGLDLLDPFPKWWILDLLGQIPDLRGSASGNSPPPRKSGGRENPCRADTGPTWARLGLGSGWPGPAGPGPEPKIGSKKHEIVMKTIWDRFARGIS